MKIESFLPTVMFLLMLSVSGGCQQSAPLTHERTEAVSTQKVIARVNGEDLLEQEFYDFLAVTRGELSLASQSAPKRELFRDFMISRIVLQEARKAGTKVESARVERYVQEWTSKEVEEAKDLSQTIRDFLMTQKFLSEKIRPQVDVSLSEILRYYENSTDEFVMEDQAHVLEILTQDRAEAERLRAELEAGDVRDFKETAIRYSVGVTASEGGDLGFYERGNLPEDFEKVIFALKPGQLSEPFQSVHGFHVFLVEEWIPRHPQKFFEVRDQVFKTLIATKEREATDAVLKEMLGKASIEIYDSSLELFLDERNSHGTKEKLD